MILAVASGAMQEDFSLTAVLVGIALLAANGGFVAAEISLLAARRGALEELAEAGDRRARRALLAHEEPSVTFSVAQLGITMCSLGLGAVAEPAIQSLFADILGLTAVPDGLIPGVALAAALALVIFLHMVVGEMAPKNLALARPEGVALRLMSVFSLFILLLRPLVVFLNWLATLLVRLVRVEPVDERQLVHTPDELDFALAESRDLGAITPLDARMLGAALRLSGIDAESAMTPRVDLDTLPDTATIDELLDLAAETGHTRIPIYHDDVDHIIGIVHVKDALIRDDRDRATVKVDDLLRAIPAVPQARDLEHLMHDMLDANNHAVLVVDEFGGTAGMLTLEDVLEELVGEIADEFDDEQSAHRDEERVWVVAGTLRRDEVERLTGVRLADGEAETVSGFLVEQLGRLLVLGDVWVSPDGWSLTVRSLEGRRAGEVEVAAPVVDPALPPE